MDFTLALMAMPLSLPLMLVIAVAIRATSKGQSVIRLSCLGRNGTTFRQYRFRTLRSDASFTAALTGAGIAKSANPLASDLVTPVGAWLLRTGLNRLPQLFNVLKGDMSLIGPAAIPVAKANASNRPDDRLLAMRPGMVSPELFLPADKPLNESDRLALSIAYAANASPRMDCRIVLQSAAHLFRKHPR